MIQNTDPTAGHGAQREFFMSRHSKFTNHEDIERRCELPSDFVGDYDAATRQAHYEHIVSVCVLDKLPGQIIARVPSIPESGHFLIRDHDAPRASFHGEPGLFPFFHAALKGLYVEALLRKYFGGLA